MNKSVASILWFTFFSHPLSSAMSHIPITTIQNVMGHLDIRPQITRQLSQDDFHDTRLVCKAWAPKSRDWYYMPDSVEKEYDKFIVKKCKINCLDKSIILLFLAYKNDLNAVRWIIHKSTIPTNIITIGLDDKREYQIPFATVAIHNNNQEIARLLIEADPIYKNENWKTVYNTMTFHDIMSQFLYTNHNRDFSFIPYIVSIFADDAHELEKLYGQKIPLYAGQRYLIRKCLEYNSVKCLDIFLKNEQARNIIEEYNESCFEVAIKGHHKEMAQKLIENKIYDINKTLGRTTILDRYYHDNKLKNDIQAQALLQDLGAKTWIEAEKEKQCCCIIQ